MTQQETPTINTVLAAGEARVNVTYASQNGDLPDPVSVDASDDDVRRWVTEALRTGGIPGIPIQTEPDVSGFVVDRCDPTEARPWTAWFLRPKTPFGMSRICTCYTCPLHAGR